MIGATVVGNPAATVITSSPFFILLSPSFGEVKAIKAKRFADEPELVKEQYLTPKNSANSFSNCSVYLPAVSQKSNAESTSAEISFSSKTRPAYGIRSPGVNVLLIFLCLTSKYLIAASITFFLNFFLILSYPYETSILELEYSLICRKHTVLIS